MNPKAPSNYINGAWQKSSAVHCQEDHVMDDRGLFEGIAGAYPRALYRAMGFGDDDFRKP